MVYRRRSGFKRRVRRTRKFPRFRARVVRTIRSVAEKKRIFITTTGSEADYDGHRIYLDAIPQGSGEGERVGRMVTPHALTAKVKIYTTSTSGSSTNIAWTAFIVQDLQTVGDAHANVSEILSGIGTTTAPMGLMNANNKGRFKILRRWQGVLGYSAGGGPSAKMLDIYHKFRKPKNIRYNGSASTDIEANSLMFVVVSDRAPTEDLLYYAGNFRFWYSDV